MGFGGDVEAALMDILTDAAEAGAPAPVNDELIEALAARGFGMAVEAMRDRLSRLRMRGWIEIEYRGTSRRRFCVGGKWTGWPETNSGGALAPRPARNAGRTRACLTCDAPFRSDGPHHRMCSACRSNASEVMGEAYRVAL